jgi:hypothetical protein
MDDTEKRLRIVEMREAIVSSPASKGQRMFEAACLVAAADHYLVRMSMVPDAEFDDVNEAAQLIFDAENEGALADDEANRALIALAEATGYSLMDLGA